MSGRPRAVLALLVVAALTLMSAWRLLLHFGTALPSDLGDPILNSWILWWNTQTLPLTAAWWHAPMFAPLPGVFAFSEALLALTPVSTPLQWLGVSPIATHNIVFLLSYPAAGMGAYALAFKLTRRHDASLIAALAFAFNPYRIAQLPHLQVQWSCWMPLALAALHDYAETGRVRALALFGACWMLNGFTNGYFLVYFPVLVAGWALWFTPRLKQLGAIGLTALLASLPLVPMLMGYVDWQRHFGLVREIGEIRAFSADVFAVFAASPRAWLASHWTMRPGPEGELYPGGAILLIAGIGVWMAFRHNLASAHAPRWSWRRRTLAGLALVAAGVAVVVMLTGGSDLRLGGLSLSMHRPSRQLTIAFWLAVGLFLTSGTVRRVWRSQSVLAFYALAAAAMYFFSWGPEPSVGLTQVLYKPPYAWLMYVPGFDSVRVPARFGLLMLVCLVQVAAIVYARFAARSAAAKRPWALGVVSIAILAEGWIVMPVAMLPAPLSVPARVVDAGALVLELPVSAEFEPNTIALYNQLAHRRPIVNGFSGYLPPHFYALGVAIDEGDVTALDGIRSAGPVGVFVDAARDLDGRSAALASRAAGAELIEATPRGQWFLLPGVTLPADPSESGAALTPSRIDATSNGDTVAAMTDGNPRTRWHGHINKPGEVQADTITMTFDQPVQPKVLVVDQGLWAAAFPRDLEVVAVTDTGDVTLFRGSLAAQTIRAAAASKNVVVRIALGDAPPARTIKLIARPLGPKWTWSIAELQLRK